MKYIKRVKHLKYHIGRIKKLETINDRLRSMELVFSYSPSPIRVIEIQLLYEQMNKILSGNTVKLREESLSDEDKKSKLVEHTKKLLNGSE